MKGFLKKRVGLAGCRLLALLAALALLGGCAPKTPVGNEEPGKNESPTVLINPFSAKGTNDHKTAYTTLPKEPRAYFVERTVPATEEGVFPQETDWPLVYSGEPVAFDLYLVPTGDPDMELGIQIFINGTPQPFTMGQSATVEGTQEPVMDYRFDADGEIRYRLPISFVPVCGKAGEVPLINVVFTQCPSYVITQEDEVGNDRKSGRSIVEAPLLFEVDAPTQGTVDALVIDTGVTPDGENAVPAETFTLENRPRKKAIDAWSALGTGDPKDLDPRFYSKVGAGIVALEGNILNIMLQGATNHTGRYRFQVLLDSEAKPVFEGKYYAEALLPDTNGEKETLFSYDIDMTPYYGAKTVQVLVIPVPESTTDFSKRVPYTEYDGSIQERSVITRISTTEMRWIRYD